MRRASISSARVPRSELPTALSPGDQTQIDGAAGRDGEDAAADAALAGQADVVGEVARAVIVAAGQHQRVDAPCPCRPDHRVAGQRVAAAGGQEQAGAGELAAAHGDGAVVEVDPEHLVDRVDQPVERAHELRERDSCGRRWRPRSGRPRRRCHGLVVGEEAQEPQDLADRLLRRVPGQHPVGDDDRAGIDERVARPAVLGLELDDRVERGSRRLAPDVAPEALADGARGARVSRKTLEMLWIEKGTSASPAQDRVPSSVATASPNCRGSTWASCGM